MMEAYLLWKLHWEKQYRDGQMRLWTSVLVLAFVMGKGVLIGYLIWGM